MDQQAIEAFAATMATALNGGHWRLHYTPRQRALWMERARLILTREI